MAKSKIILFAKPYENGKNPVYLRVTHKRKARFFALGIECTPDQWNKECRVT